jgi:hypothetical protein
VTAQKVYVMWNGTCSKVGISAQPRARRGNVANSIIHCMTEATEDARRIERAAHVLLDAHWAGGEWFNVVPDVAQKAVAKASEMVTGSIRWESVQHIPITGRPCKESALGTKHFIGLRVSPDLRQALERKAAANKSTIATEARKAIEMGLEADRKRKPAK